MYVYFIRSGKKGAIKIGKSNNPEKRVKELQTGNPYKLYLIAFIHCETEEGAIKLERKIHRLFKKRRMIGEWFHPHINLKDVTEIKFKKREEQLDHIDPEILSHMADIMKEC